MEYYDKASGDQGLDVDPGVKLACDEFLVGKPERVMVLYGNYFLYWFLRKAN